MDKTYKLAILLDAWQGDGEAISAAFGLTGLAYSVSRASGVAVVTASCHCKDRLSLFGYRLTG
jgi:hypothetical protein